MAEKSKRRVYNLPFLFSSYIDKNNVVYCGNTRLKVARKLGLEEVPCIVVTDLTPKQMREYALLDNKTNETADWELELLAEEMKDVSLEEFALDWGIAELENKKEIVEDNCNLEKKLQEEPICKRVRYGDLETID